MSLIHRGSPQFTSTQAPGWETAKGISLPAALLPFTYMPSRSIKKVGCSHENTNVVL